MIKNTALMRNSEGGVYHLHLHPGDLAETVILVGDPQRSRQIATYFDHIEKASSHREFSTFTGTVGNKRLSVVSTGVGAGGVDVVINEIDALFNIDFETGNPKEQITQLQFVRFGTTGAVQADLPIGSLVTSVYAFATDGLLHYYQRHQSEKVKALECALQQSLADLPVMHGVYAAQADPDLVALFEPLVARAGITFSCNGFFSPQGRQLRQSLPYPDFIEHISHFEFDGYQTTNIEMETAAIYGLSESLGHKACSISAVMANRLCETVGRYHIVVEEMVHRLFERLLSGL